MKTIAILLLSLVLVATGCAASNVYQVSELNDTPSELINPLGKSVTESFLNTAADMDPEIKKQTDEFVEFIFTEVKENRNENIPVYESRNSDDPSSKDLSFGLIMLSSMFTENDAILVDEYYGESVDGISKYTVESASEDGYNIVLPIEGCRAYKIYKYNKGLDTDILILVLQFSDGWKLGNMSSRRIITNGFDKDYWFEKGEYFEKEGYIIPAYLMYGAAMGMTHIPYYKYKDEKYLSEKESFINSYKDEANSPRVLEIEGQRVQVNGATLNMGRPGKEDFYEITYISSLDSYRFNQENIEREVEKINNYLLENKIIFNVGKMIYHAVPKGTTFKTASGMNMITVLVE